jgi:hypothetical protein
MSVEAGNAMQSRPARFFTPPVLRLERFAAKQGSRTKAAPRLRAIETQHVFPFAAVNRRVSHYATGDRPKAQLIGAARTDTRPTMCAELRQSH